MFGFYDRRCVCCVDILVGRIKMEIRCKQDTAEITWLNAQFSQGENKIPMSLTFSSFSSYFLLFSYFLIFSSFVSPLCVIFLLVPFSLFPLQFIPSLIATSNSFSFPFLLYHLSTINWNYVQFISYLNTYFWSWNIIAYF